MEVNDGACLPASLHSENLFKSNLCGNDKVKSVKKEIRPISLISFLEQETGVAPIAARSGEQPAGLFSLHCSCMSSGFFGCKPFALANASSLDSRLSPLKKEIRPISLISFLEQETGVEPAGISLGS